MLMQSELQLDHTVVSHISKETDLTRINIIYNILVINMYILVGNKGEEGICILQYSIVNNGVVFSACLLASRY